MSTLKTVLQAHQSVREAYFASCDAIWVQFQKQEPAITAALRELGWRDADLGAWVTSPLIDGASPADLVANGQSKVVEDRIQAMLHGQPS